MPHSLSESDIEELALAVLHDDNGYTVRFGPELAEGPAKEREYHEVILTQRLRQAVDRLNPAIPAAARAEAVKQVLRAGGMSLLESNEAFHRLLTDGVDVKFSIGDGKSKTAKVWLIDWVHPTQNEFLAVNQFTVIENHHNKRPDIVLFVNGLPLVVIELKNASDEHADIQAAFHQLQTYKQQIPALFVPNALLVISDGWSARVGSLSSDYSRFMAWKSAGGADDLRLRRRHQRIDRQRGRHPLRAAAGGRPQAAPARHHPRARSWAGSRR